MHQPCDTELQDFINQCKIRLQKILDRLEWSEKATLKDFNTNSIACSLKDVPKKPTCQKISTYPDSCDTENSLVLETSKLQTILGDDKVQAPRNFRELQANFSREQKLKIYEYVIENTKKLENNTVDQDLTEGGVSLADILAQKKREDKHKKRRFRKSKPTHIEEVRCLVDLQMQALQQFMDNKLKHDQQYICHSRNFEKDGNRKDKRKYYEEYYGREQKRKTHSEHRVKPDDDLRRYSRSPSNEYIRQQHKRYKTISSKELSYEKAKISERYSKEKSPIMCSSKERRKYRRSRSSERYTKNQSQNAANKRHRSRSYKRRSRSHFKDISKERQKSRSRSCERYARKKENDCSRKYFSRKEFYGYYEDSKEKCFYEYNRNESRCSEASSVQQKSAREDAKSIYCNEDYRSLGQNRRCKKDKYHSNKKSSKHKKKKHKRDHS